jgi:rhamnose utilization protein RhaD (predicted bifunctional aldolase and dehydrogenase)/NAD(P)-dependent dehydrogenase (short-subunit alcohol dehydrogenase family)
MENLWKDSQPTQHGPLDACVYGSRLIGSDPYLVLHGGGNTSVKAPYADITGRSLDAIYVKGSGWDLATIEAPGFAPLRLPRLLELLALETLPDTDMMRELSAAKLDPAAPQPSVETLLHAFLPHEAVQHSHADVIVTLTNLADGEDRVRELFGDTVIVVPYVMPGFELARVASTLWEEQARDDTTGMVLLNHGLFTFAETTREAYNRHVDLITLAEQWLDEHAPVAPAGHETLPPVDATEVAELRRQVSQAAGRPMIVTRHSDAAAARFVQRDDVASLATRGPLTPDHVIRTKRTPMIGTDVAGYAEEYRRYFAEHAARSPDTLTMLDPAPRVVIDEHLGVLTAGETAKASSIAADIYLHTMVVLERSEDRLGGYVALPAADLFDVEYWDLEQAKLRRAGPPPELAGTVAVVTGAASGIGRACASELLNRGGAVAGIDRDESVEGSFGGPAWLGIVADVTDPDAQHSAVDAAVERFGGVDIVVVSAGVFGATAPISELAAASWRSVQAVNVDAVASLFEAVHPMLARSPVGGRVAVVGSKNVAAPGPGASAYSVSKAALTQLARVAALEWAGDRIRVNTVHPDAVFDTGLWNDELIAERAGKYSMTIDEYKTRNLLGTEVTSAGVAQVVAELCSDTFSATTGAQIPIDGGNERVI